MAKDKYARLREQVQKIEQKIFAITGNHPTFDFRQKILSMGSSVEVLGPSVLRNFIAEEIGWMSEKYE